MTVTEAVGVRGLVLACGPDTPELPEVEGVRVERLPARPGKTDVDPLLTDDAAAHLVVVGTDADFAAVVLRLLRRDRLADTTVGYVPTERSSAVAALWGLPGDPRHALALALGGEVDPVPLIRDDAGGVLVGRGVLGPVRGVAYCDDEVALRGLARRIEVEPDPHSAGGGPGLVVRVSRGLLFRRQITYTGRAVQLGCVPVTPVSDGVPYPRPMSRWTWYKHTEPLRLVRGLA
nr:hypothetical protein [Amycolatopsis arida]